MLQITIQPAELWDESKQEFVGFTRGQTLQLEHSLVSISKWESKWRKSYLSTKKKTKEEALDYIKCMTITQNVDPSVYDYLTKENIDKIDEYINSPMTATVINDSSTSRSSEKITSELIYYWMVSMNIPFECQKWHLSRLLMLIKVCEIKNRDPKKVSQKGIMSRNAALNAARRRKYNTRG